MPARSPAAEWLAAGFLLTFSSAFGQTFFVALFAGELKAEFDIGDGRFGAYYTVATLVSSGVLILFGKVADRDRLRIVAMLTLGGLAATCLAMAWSSAGWMLLPIFFGLRFFGQGMLGHVSLTAMARWFTVARGKAIAFAAMGNPASQAVFPVLAVVLSAAIGWRLTWVAAAGFIVVAAMPLVFLCLRREPGASAATERVTTVEEAGRPHPPRRDARDWTRAEVLRDPAFHLLMPGVLAPSFVITGVFFHQVALVASKGWDLTWFAGWVAANAAATIVATLTSGWLIDRIGSSRLLPFFLAPLGVGVMVLGLAESRTAVPVFMILAGVSAGSSATLLGALWAEIYGTRHLGAIRSLAMAGSVFASAIAPGLIGVLLDLGVDIDRQLVGLAIYTLASAALLVAVAPGLSRRRNRRLRRAEAT
jgi:MFS family permease